MKTKLNLLVSTIAILLFTTNGLAQSYPIVGTDVSVFFDNNFIISTPSPGDPFYGQDAQYPGNPPSYTDNGDTTITDNITGLMWQRSPDHNGDNNGIIDFDDKLIWDEIQDQVIFLNSSNYAGYNDWRIPTIKDLYSLSNWNGTDPSGVSDNSTDGLTPFIDDTYFQFAWGDTDADDRLIDVQYASTNIYNDLSCLGNELLFGFNFADGRIKGYGVTVNNVDETFYLICVRGNTSYGINDFVDNGDQTISDNATGLMWAKDDSQSALNWEEALAWAQTQNDVNYNGYSDWRVPNAQELHSIFDYSRSPGSTNSAAIDPIFNISSITNEADETDWPYFWSSTTHIGYNGTDYNYTYGAYLCFGKAAGWVQIPPNTYYTYCDVHGAGAQRTDPKSGTWFGDLMGVDINGDDVYGWGPQGDLVRVSNYVRLVRRTGLLSTEDNEELNYRMYPNPAKYSFTIASQKNLKTVVVFNSVGMKILEQQVNQMEVTINTNQLSNGIYFVKIVAADGSISADKIVIQK